MSEATIILIFAASFVVALSGALTPGPLLALTISEAARRGFWAGPLLILGHAILELAVVVILVLGLSRFIESKLTLSIVGVAGGIVLMGMGFLAIRKGWQRASMPGASSVSTSHSTMLVLSGVLGSVSNPYWFLWWATIGVTYLLWSLELGGVGVASFFTGHIFADFSWYALVAFVIATGKRAMSDTVFRWLLVVCGLAVVALGIYFAVSGVKFLVG